jgi:hypothetical protein
LVFALLPLPLLLLPLKLLQLLAIGAKQVGEEGWLVAAAAAVAAAVAAAAAAAAAADDASSTTSSTSNPHLLLAGLLDASASARRLLCFPALCDVQRCVCDALFVAAAAAAASSDSHATSWGAARVLSDLFTGSCFGSTGDVWLMTDDV